MSKDSIAMEDSSYRPAGTGIQTAEFARRHPFRTYLAPSTSISEKKNRASRDAFSSLSEA
jgi:hypothetical protein